MTEEAQRVLDAMNDLEAIADPTAKARAISEVLMDSKKRNPRLKEMRRTVVLEMQAQKMSIRKIATAIGVSPSTVQDIIRGYSSSWGNRAKASTDQSDLPTEESST